MRGRVVGTVRLVVALILTVLVLVGLMEVIGPTAPFGDDAADAPPRDLPADPAELDAWLDVREDAVADLRPAARKRILWAGEAGARTPLAIVYLHGYSASAEEVRPLPDRVAGELGANLHFARLAGHGRDGPAMAQATVPLWRADLAEALAVGRSIGERTVIVSSSTGGTLAVLAALREGGARGLAGIVLMSPNLRAQGFGGRLIEWPWFARWGPLIAGRTRGFTPVNAEHADHWTERYPTRSLATLGALTRHVRRLDAGAADMPALILLSPTDAVIERDLVRRLAQDWGGPAELVEIELGPGDDPAGHVLAGDILSPDRTDEVAFLITDWARRQLSP